MLEKMYYLTLTCYNVFNNSNGRYLGLAFLLNPDEINNERNIGEKLNG